MAMKNGQKRCMFVAMVLLILGTFLFSPGLTQAKPPEGELKEAIHWAVSADWFDPGTGNSGALGWFPLSILHDALLKPMPEGAHTPCLAESYSNSPDFKVFEFKLRKGVKFHNGDILTAEDVVFSFSRYRGRLSKDFQEILEKIETVDPYLVRFRFKRSFPDFLEYFLIGGTTAGWIAPKKYIEKVGEAGFKQRPIGAGPYKFVEFVPGVKLVVEAFEDYWRKVPNIKRIEFRLIPDATTRLAMVKRGEVDIATLITDVLLEEVKKDPKLRLLTPLSPSKFPITLAAQWDPKSPWSDVRVRKAASLAIDRQTLADIHSPGCKPTGTLGIEGGSDPWVVEFPPDPYDPKKAKQLLAEAGYPNGFQGGKFYPDTNYWGSAEQVTTYWKAVGINVEMVRLERPAWFAMRESGKLKGGIIPEALPGASIASRLAYLFSPQNSYGQYPDIQALWEQFLNEYRPDVRKSLIERIQRLMHEKTMMIHLTQINSPAAVGPKVKGNPYKIQPLIWFTAPLEDIELN
jgi:peptide/nickel transport system substrate-binding protein